MLQLKKNCDCLGYKCGISVWGVIIPELYLDVEALWEIHNRKKSDQKKKYQAYVSHALRVLNPRSLGMGVGEVTALTAKMSVR